MAEKKKLVSEITSMDVDFAQWYTDIVKKADLIDYSSVRGRAEKQRLSLGSQRRRMAEAAHGQRHPGG